MISVKDQLGNSIQMSRTPKRIISLVPSQTELLYDLGLGEKVVGITKFCIHPNEWFKNKVRVGGTKNVALEKVKELQPDLIIGNKEENDKTNIQQLSSIAPVWMSDIHTLQDSYSMIFELGELLNVVERANKIITKIKEAFSDLKKEKQPTNKSVLYLIWKDPYMGVGANTFIHDILTHQLGFKNFLSPQKRYPIIEIDKIKSPDFIFLSSEPYPFKEKHVQFLKKQFPESSIKLVDGEYFSWYGSRLIHAPTYFSTLL